MLILKVTAMSYFDSIKTAASGVGELAGNTVSRVTQGARSMTATTDLEAMRTRATDAVFGVGNATYNLIGSAASQVAQGARTLAEKTENTPVAPVVRSAVAIAGAGSTAYLWAGAAASTAGKQALRAGCIRNSLWVVTGLSLPVERATAVFLGTRLSNYISQGIVPGAFAAWALYDGYKVGRWAYDKYYCSDSEESVQLTSKL